MHPLITPDLGQVFWTSVTFFLLLIILRVFAWKPILQALKNRNESIRDALDSAENARKEMASLKTDNEKILKEARKEKDLLLTEARKMKEQIIREAKFEAETEAKKLVEMASIKIQNEKLAAVNEIKTIISDLSVEIAEKLLREQLSDHSKQEKIISEMLKDIELN